MNQVQVLLALQAAVLDGVKQLRVESRHPRQLLGIVAVVLALAGGDDRNLARVGHDDLVPLALQQPADPRRMSARFQRDPHPRLVAELLLQRRDGAPNPALFHQLSAAGQHAVMAITVAQIQPHDPLWLTLRCKGSLLFADLLRGWSPLHSKCVSKA